MSEVGFGSHFSWYAGSSCTDVRRRAIRLLPEVIQAHHDAYVALDVIMKAAGGTARDAAISPPIGVLIALVREASEYLDTSAYELKNTWQCTSDILQAHISAGKNAGSDSEMNLANACVEFWTPKIRAASERIDRMGFYAEDWLHDGPIIGRKKKL